jgi:ArsR family transcriptional regulator
MPELVETTTLFQLFGEPTRVRLLSLLAREELSVADLVTVTDLPQSRVSQHLGKLREAGVLRDRKNGTSTYYALSASMPDEARKIWSLLDGTVDDGVLASDRARMEKHLASKSTSARTDALAGQMERHYSPGRTWESLVHALVPLVSLGDVLDAGSGDGTIAELLAGRARSVTCLDRSETMIAAAKRRLSKSDRVELVVGDVEAMPFEGARFDRVFLFNVLVFVSDPGKAIAEAARVLRPGGEIVIVTLDAHEHAGVAESWGHAHCGIAASKLRAHMKRAGLAIESCEVTSRERRAPNLSVITAHGRLP